MEILITCTYCGHRLIKNFYDPKSVENLACEKCGDKNLEARDYSQIKIDSYAGAPPFPQKNKN